MRRLPRAITAGTRVVIALGTVLVAVVGLASGAGAQGERSPGGDDPGRVDIVEVSGYLDPVLADFVGNSIDGANQDGSRGIVLHLDSGGAVVDDERVAAIAESIAASQIPVVVWVGPSSDSRVEGRVGQLLGVADDVGMAAGSHIGDFGDLVVDRDLLSPAYAEAVAGLAEDTAGVDRAVELGLAVEAPTLGLFVADLPFVDTEVDDSGDEPERIVTSEVRFAQLPLVNQLFHTMASPAIAYLLFVIGMSLLVFELYTAGVGIAGVIGAGCFIGGCYGLDVLPARWWAVGLLVISAIAFAIDVQVGVPRFWSGVGVLSLVVGTVVLYDGVGFSWITQLAGIAGISVAMLAGMPAMVRTRFSTPTIGREWLVGERGVAAEPVDPEGTVTIREVQWRARTNRATPIEEGEEVTVASIEGVVLEVEPIEGAARDYRERD